MSETATISQRAQEVKTRVNLVEVVGKYLSLTRRGREYVAMCPFHDDHHASLKVNEEKQVWNCFACPDSPGGDAIDFLVRKGRSFQEAVAELEEMSGAVHAQAVAQPKRKDNWKQVRLDPRHGRPVFRIRHYKHGEPSGTWEYTDRDGNLIGWVCRFDLPEGKQILPHVLCTNGYRHEWRWQGFEKPRPLYRLHEIYRRPADIVLVVEGEKTCEAAAKLFPELVCTTWMGGAQGIYTPDWTPLRDRNVILWPDNDVQGNEAMLNVAKLLMKDGVSRIRLVVLPDGFPKHWDVADASWSKEEARDFLKKHLYQVRDMAELKR